VTGVNSTWVREPFVLATAGAAVCYTSVRLLERRQVLTAASMTMAVFWVNASCCVVKFTDVSEMLTAFAIKSLMIDVGRGVPDYTA
jgi:hypothetical protein